MYVKLNNAAGQKNAQTENRDNLKHVSREELLYGIM
jgi:hypothetical protein